MGKSIVLVFHKEENGQLFEKIILALKARYELVSLIRLEELLLDKKGIKNICHISFDDGEKSFYNIIFPILKKHQIPVSLFVSPYIINTNSNFWFQEMEGYDEKTIKNILSQLLNISFDKMEKYSSSSILKCLPFSKIKRVAELYRQQTNCGKKSPKNMNADQLREVEASGLVTIGAHTLNHPVLKNEDDYTSCYEITESVKRLEALLDHPIKYFAYPNGRPGIDFGEREMNYLSGNKITMAFSTELGHLNYESNLLSIPRMGFARMGLPPSNPLIAFRLYLGKRWINIKSIGKPSEKKVREQIGKLLNF
jgi:peptidoglycan/xylan/chitin deacetylase (PgdA/CDA1 family)